MKKIFYILIVLVSYLYGTSSIEHFNTMALHNKNIKEIVFIDEGLEDINTLQTELLKHSEVVLIEKSEHPLLQMQRALKNHHNLDAIHLLTHGSNGALHFSNFTLSSENIERYKQELKKIGQSLNADGDILLYGCNVAKDLNGEEFINSIAKQTNADIAASNDLTGISGNWDLENKSGDIETISINNYLYSRNLVTFSNTASSAQQIGSNLYLYWSFDWSAWGNSSDKVTITMQYKNISGGTSSKTTQYSLSTYSGSVGGSFVVTPSDANPPGDQSSGNNNYSNYRGVFGGDETKYFQYSFTANAAPTISNTASNQAVNDTATLTPFSGVTLADADADNISMTITLDTNAKGVLSGTGLSGSGPYTISSASAASVQSTLRALSFNPTDNRVASSTTETTTFTLVANDGSDTTSNTATTVVSTSVNDAPTDISISSASVNQSAGANASVGTFSSVDVDTSETFAYSIVASGASANGTCSDASSNASFSVSGATLLASSAGSMSEASYNICVQTNDGDTTYQKTLTISVVDDVAPTLGTLSPLDNATEIPRDANFVITFSENIQIGTGDINLRKSDGTLVENMTVSGSQVTTSGNQVTINPAVLLDINTQYYIDIPSAAIKDYASSANFYAGTASTTWSFTSITNSTPVFDAGATNTLAVDEDSGANDIRSKLIVSDADGAQTLTWSQNSPPSHGTLSFASATASSGLNTTSGGTITYAPTLNYVGVDSFIVQVSDGNSGVDTITVNVTVANVNDAPTAINGARSVNEDATLTFASTDFNFADIDSGDLLEHITIVSPTSSGTLSTTSGDVTTANIASLTYIPNTNYNGSDSFTYKVNDGEADSISTYTMTITVSPVNDAPVMADATGTLTDITENDILSVGDSIASLLNASADVTDNDDANDPIGVGEGNVRGIALYGVSITDASTGGVGTGKLQYDNGSGWTDVSSVSEASALHLDNNDKLRFLPDANNGNEISINYYAWDDSSANSGDRSSVATRGTTTAYSTLGATASMSATDVNDIPSSANKTVVTDEDSDYTFTSSDFAFTDIDTSAVLNNILIVSLPTNGKLFLNTTQLNASDTVATADIASLKYNPDLNHKDEINTDSFTFKVNDSIADSASAYTITLQVDDVNDAPVVDASANVVLTTITEDEVTNAGNTVTQLVTQMTEFSDVDDTSLGNNESNARSIAIFATSVTPLLDGNGTGIWQYSIDGTTWVNVEDVNETNALLLESSDKVRFISDGKNGSNAGFSFYGWDQQTGNAGNKVDVSSRGLTTSFSLNPEDANVSVTSQNDRPIIDLDSNAGTLSVSAQGEITGHTAYATEYIVRGVATKITSSDVNISDSDNNSTISSATINIASGANDYAIEYIYTNLDLSSYGVTIDGNKSHTITFSGVASEADYETIIESVMYKNDNDYAFPGDRVINVNVVDGNGTATPDLVNETSLTAVSTLTVVWAPVVDLDQDDSSGVTGNGFTNSFVEGEANKTISDSDIMLLDLYGDNNLQKMIVNITNVKGDDFLDYAGNLLTAVWDGVSELVVSGLATVQDYIAVLREIVFGNTSENPDETTRIISVQAQDSDGNWGDATSMSMDVTAVNDVPTISNVVDLALAEDFTSSTVSFTIGDLDQQDLNVSVTLSSANMTTSYASQVVSYATYNAGVISVDLLSVANANSDINGTTTVTLNVSDGTANVSDSFVVTINASQDIPTLGTYNDRNTSEDFTTFVVELLPKKDVDDENITYTVTSGDTAIATAVLNADSNLEITSKVNASGSVLMTITGTDGVIASPLTKTFTLNVAAVNDTPTIDTTFLNVDMLEDNGTTTYDLNISDIEGSDLNLTVESNNTAIITVTPNWTNLLNQAAWTQPLDFNLTTVANANGMVRITMNVDDGDLNSTQTFDVNVSAVNDTPVFTNDDGNATVNKSVTENIVTTLSSVTTQDVENDTLTYSLMGVDATLFNLVNTNELQFKVAPNFESPLDSGADNIYNVDVNATDDGTPNESSLQHFVITVMDINDVPVASDKNVTEVEGVTTIISTVVGTDEDSGATKTFSTTATVDGFTFYSDGSYIFDATHATYDSLYVGETQVIDILVTVTDDVGATDTLNLKITLTGTNDTPVATADVGVTTENADLTFSNATLTSNDTDVDTGAVLTVTAVATPMGQGSVTLANDGNVSFYMGTDFDDLALGATETVIINYAVSDENSAESNSTITVIVTGTNDAPIAVADTGATSENVDLSFSNATLTSNDTDVDTGAVLTVTAVATPMGQGSVTLANDGNVSFYMGTDFDDLALGATETVIINYAVSDENSAESNSTITVIVTGTNDTPVASADIDKLSQEDASLITGLIVSTDLDNNAALRYATNESLSGFTLDTNGSYSFNPADSAYQYLNVGESKIMTIAVVVSDEHNATDNMTITITIVGTNGIPTANDVVSNTSEDSVSISGTVVAIDEDTTATHTFITTYTIDGFTLNSDGTYSFDPSHSSYQYLNVGEVETIVIPVTLSDDNGAQTTMNVTLVVSGTNDKPIASSSVTHSMVEGTGFFVGQFSATDKDTTAVFTYTSDAVDGFEIIGDTGYFTFDANNSAYDYLSIGQSTAKVITITVTDDNGDSDDTNLTLTLSGSNDKPIITSNSGAEYVTLAYTENSTDVLTAVSAIDYDSDVNTTYSVANNFDYSYFEVNATTGEVSFMESPDYETKLLYAVQVIARDNHNEEDAQTFSIDIANVTENEDAIDTDGDGIPDASDPDDDNDGIPDDEEGVKDSDGDGIPDSKDSDSDNDGIPDDEEGTEDTDGDGIPNYKDDDSDNDGVPDVDEGNGDNDGDGIPDSQDPDSTGTKDTDGDGIPDASDPDDDNDGISDEEEGANSIPLIDTDNDGIPDYKDDDSDNDGVKDIDEGSGDEDGDGVPDSQDSDSTGTKDTDGDGIPDASDTDDDNDGISDEEEGANNVPATDSDNDGIPDYKDEDSDNDGFKDIDEGNGDSDGDGIPDNQDSDSTGTKDSDGDGVSDIDEGSAQVPQTDSDSDGVPDYLDRDSDNDGIADAYEGSSDTDGDGIPDYIDSDSDNDGIPDNQEGSGDSDGDGIPDAKDTDSDNDGISDEEEGNLDTDNDGIPNYKDEDSDGDGQSDKSEYTLDDDGDGVSNYLDSNDAGSDAPIDNGDGTETSTYKKVPGSGDDVTTNVTTPNGLPSTVTQGNDNSTIISFDTPKVDVNITNTGGLDIAMDETNGKHSITVANPGADINISSDGNMSISTPTITNADGSTCKYNLNIAYDGSDMITRHILGQEDGSDITTTVIMRIPDANVDVTADNRVIHTASLLNENAKSVDVTAIVNCSGAISTTTKLEDVNATFVAVNRPGSTVIIEANGDVDTTTALEADPDSAHILEGLNFKVDSATGDVNASKVYKDTTTDEVTYTEAQTYLAGAILNVNGNSIAEVDVDLTNVRLVEVNITSLDENNISIIISSTTAVDSSIVDGDITRVSSGETGAVTTEVKVGTATIVVDNLLDGKTIHRVDFNGSSTTATSTLEGADVNVSSIGVTTTYEDESLKAEVIATIDGLAKHIVEIAGVVTEALSQIVGASTVIGKDENGEVKVVTKVETTNDNQRLLSIEVDALASGEAQHIVTIDGESTSAISEIPGAKTTIKPSGEVETNATLETDVSVSVKALPDGTAIHRVSFDGLVSRATSELPGANTLISANGLVQTSVESSKDPEIIGGERWVFEAVVQTDVEGKTITTFQKRNATTGEVSDKHNTYIPNTPYNAGSSVVVKEINGRTFIKTTAALTTDMTVE